MTPSGRHQLSQCRLGIGWVVHVITAGSNRQILICRQIVVHMAAMEAAPVALLQKQMLN